jgi:hypothetical protein
LRIALHQRHHDRAHCAALHRVPVIHVHERPQRNLSNAIYRAAIFTIHS